MVSIPEYARGRGTQTGITIGAKMTTRTRILWGSGLTPSVRPSRVSAALWDFLTSADSLFLAYSLEVSVVTRAPAAGIPQTRIHRVDCVKIPPNSLSRRNGRAIGDQRQLLTRVIFAERFQRVTEIGLVSTWSDFDVFST